MKYLIFDCSSNGKPKNWNAPHTDSINWPRLLHLAWHLYDEKFNVIKGANDLVKPRNFKITDTSSEKKQASSEMSGMLQEQSMSEGLELEEVLNKFKKVIDEADYLFAFNMKYNRNVVAAEFFRTGIEHRLFSVESYCVMEESTHFCGIRGKNGRYKWPSLVELHTKIFGRDYSGANLANRDLEAVARCLIVLLKKEIIDLF